MKAPKLRIAFVVPVYEHTFADRRVLEERGHQVDIFVPTSYPEDLLHEQDRLYRGGFLYRMSGRMSRIPSIGLRLLGSATWVLWLLRHDSIQVFGRISTIAHPAALPPQLVLAILRMSGKRVYYSPGGCRDEALKLDWETFDGGRVCGNCAIEESCDDRANEANIRLVNAGGVVVAGTGSSSMPRLARVEHFRVRSLDLDAWNPDLVPPTRLQWAQDGRINLLHSFASNSRDDGRRNIKGTYFLRKAVEHLQERYPELLYYEVRDVPARDMKYVQVQADIVVDQLLYGWWGSTTLECLALGRPVVCYLRDEFLVNFNSHFADLEEPLPVVNASVDQVGQAIEALILDPDLRVQLGRRSRRFAEAFLSPAANAEQLETFLTTRF